MTYENVDLTEAELAWLAGLLEGEGSFCKAMPSSPGQPVLQVVMTDEDVIAKAATMIGSRYYVSQPKNPAHKTCYHLRVKGKRAIQVMELLHPHMGLRRQQQISEALATASFKGRSWVPPEVVREIREAKMQGESTQSLSDRFGLSKSAIKGYANGSRRSDV